MRHHVSNFKADCGSYDSARNWMRCLDIVSVGDGRPMPWRTFVEPKFEPKDRSNSWRSRNMILPPWLVDMAQYSMPASGDGGGHYANMGRNNFVFMLSRYLVNYGLDDSLAYRIAMENGTETDERKEDVVRRGIERGKADKRQSLRP